MKHGFSLLYSFALLISDFVALTAAFTLAYIVRVKIDDRPLLDPITSGEYIAVIAVLLVFWVLIYAQLGLYKPSTYENRFREFYLLLIGSVIGILFLIGAEYVLNRAIFPARLVTVYGFIFAFLYTLLFRTIARAIKRTLYRYDIGINSVLIVGSSNITQEFVKGLSRKHSGNKLLGVVGDKRLKIDGLADSMRYSSLTEAVDALGSNNITSIVQTELFANDERNDEILAFAQQNHISYRFIPGNSRLFFGNIDVELYENIPTISVNQTALTGWGRTAKRLFDLVFGTLLLIVSLPFMALIWSILTIFDGGDAVYKQTRLSRYNTKIGLFKFRTHKHTYNGLTPEEAFAKMGKPELAKEYRDNGDQIENDPRISRLGNFLRKTSLDELPQLFNVVRGDISLVGPRPLIPEELKSYGKKSVILSVKPGITGLAVISGRRDIPFEERRKLDMYYAQNWTFRMDVVILLKTIVMVLRGVGAR